MPAFTAFLLGSGQRHQKTPNINSSFFEACEEEHPLELAGTKQAIILDGPQKLGGAYDPQKIRENVTEAVARIKAWLKTAEPDAHGKYPINLTGFSRGGVTCLKIANALQQLESFDGPDGKKISRDDLVVNIFVEDPVSGMGDKGDATTKIIPPIVKTFVATYQMDERRRGFKPQDLSRLIYDPLHTQLVVLPMPGSHGALNRVKEGTKEGALIHWNLKYDFLRQHGTVFKEDKLPAFVGGATMRDDEKSIATPSQLLDYYARLQNNRTAYVAEAASFQIVDMPLPGVERTFNQKLRDYVVDDFFVNQHQRELFKTTYPIVFNYLFENGKLDPDHPTTTGGRRVGGQTYGYSDDELGHEMVSLREHNPLLFDRLEKANLVAFRHGVELPERPHGMSRIEDCKLLEYALSGNPIEHNPLSLLDEEIRIALYRYIRDKSSYMAMSERSEAERAQQIREELRTVRNNNEPNEEIKYRDALLRLEKHLLELKSYNNSSQLTRSLEDILKRHGRVCTVTVQPTFRSAAANYLGSGLQMLGRTMQRVGRVLATVGASIGKGIDNFGKRMIEAAGSIRNRALRGIASAFAYLVGGALRVAGKIIGGISKSVDKLGGLIKKSGENVIRTSGMYSAKISTAAATLPRKVSFERVSISLVSPDHQAHKTADIDRSLGIRVESLASAAAVPSASIEQNEVRSVSPPAENAHTIGLDAIEVRSQEEDDDNERQGRSHSP